MIVIRLGNHHSHEKPRKEFIDAIKRNEGSCDEVWLTGLYGFPPIEKHYAEAKRLVETAEKFREAGIRVSFQIANTIGHGSYMKAQDNSGLNNPDSKVQHMVGPDGTVAGYCYCYNDPVMRDFTRREVEAYAEIRPYRFWIDDDFRAEYHDPVQHGCFCDSCVKKFNEKYSHSLSREELWNKIESGELRAEWIAFVRENMASFGAYISEGMLKVSPDTLLGIQYVALSNYAGGDMKYAFDALNKLSPAPVASRPGYGFYRDTDISDIMRKAHIIAYSNSVTPDYVKEIRPEIENTPDVPFGKTIYGTLLESSLYLSCGCTGLSYAYNMTPYEPLEWHEKMLRGFSTHRAYWQKLIDISKATKNGGCAAFVSKNEPFAKTDWTKYKFTRETLPARWGLAASFDSDAAKVMLLGPDEAECLTEADFDGLLRRPVMLTQNAAAVLYEKGFRFGVKSTATDCPTYSIEFGHDRWKGDNFSETRPLPLCVIEGGEETAKLINTVDGSVIGSAECVITTKYGARWAVMGDYILHFVISSPARKHAIMIADAICANTLPAILDEPYKLMLLPRVDDNGKTVSVGLFHYGIGKTEGALTLRIRQPIGERFYAFDEHGREVLPVKREGEEYIVTVPPMDAVSMRTVVIEN